MPTPHIELTPRLRRALNFGGLTLGVLGLLFVVQRVRLHLDETETNALSSADWYWLGALAGVCAATCLLLGLAWWLLLRVVGLHVDRVWAVRVHGITQLAKYVPGNVVQFLGRQGVAMGSGLPGREVAKSTGYELASLGTAGALFTPLLLPRITAMPDAGAVAVFGAAVAGAIMLTRRHLGLSSACALGLHILFLSIMGAVFAIVVTVTADADHGPGVGYMAGAYVIAWLVGLLTPGSPAGLGIREALLIGLLHGLPEGEIVQAVVLGRAVNVLGDAAFFLLAWALPRGAVVSEHR